MGDDGADAARGGAGAPPADLPRPGARRAAEVPALRRSSPRTSEGWGLYAESLGEDMGLYKTTRIPSSASSPTRCGARSARRRHGHARDGLGPRARDRYFMDNAAKTEHDITNEIDRYISWPGQALAYKIGELKIKELRRKARTGSARGSISATSTTSCCSPAPCRSRFSSSVSTSGSPATERAARRSGEFRIRRRRQSRETA